MRKAVLEQNILPKAKQRFLVEGFPQADVIYLTRDVIQMQLGVIELPDQTAVPGGRRRMGEFTTTLQLARDLDRNVFLKWFEQCIDQGRSVTGYNQSVPGINPNYKRSATLIYHRLYIGTAGTGRALQPVKARLTGCWPSQMSLPDYDINGDEGDGDCNLEVTIRFDDVEVLGL